VCKNFEKKLAAKNMIESYLLSANSLFEGTYALD